MSAEDIFFDRVSSLESKSDQAKALIWFVGRSGKPSITIVEISNLFHAANLSRPNHTRLLRALIQDREAIVAGNAVSLHRDARKRFAEEYGAIFETSKAIEARIRISEIPFLKEGKTSEARQMAELYMVAYCLENSVRALVSTVLNEKLGDDWFKVAASTSMKQKHAQRLDNEAKKKWAPTRSDLGPLYSLDWSDLCTLMRKYACSFLPFIGEINFLHRFEDLGELRNVIAHHGFFDDKSQIKRIELACLDWVGQNKGHSI